MGNKEKQRVPIRKRVRGMMLFIITVALLITSLVGVVSMFRIRKESERSLIERMESNLSNVAESKARLADAEFDRYEDQVVEFADYINGLYLDPEDYKEKEILPPDKANGGVYSIQRGLRTEDVKYEDVADEVKLLGNLEQIFRPVINGDSEVITTIYAGTESGVMIAYDKDADKSAAPDGGDIYIDYFDSTWYQKAKETGKVCFTDVYEDYYGRGLTITCAAPFYDADGKFAGVVAMDMLISDLYDAVVTMELEGDDSYAFIIDSLGNAISPDAAIKTIDDDPDIDDNVKSLIMSDASGVTESDRGFYYAYAPISGVGWTLCIHVPETTVLAPAKAMDLRIYAAVVMMLVVFLIVMIVSVFMSGILAKQLAMPIMALGEDAKVISGGDLDHRAKIYRNDEIGDLADSFNNMALSLKKYIQDLTTVTAEKERIGAELNVATQIQADMLPRIFPPFPDRNEFDLYASMTPAKEVGGDFYDFFLIDDDHVGLVMADVSGKGVPAALFMVIAKTHIKNRAMMGGSPSEILSYANDQLCEGNEAELFVTVWMAIIQISTGKGLAANAGHEHPAIKRKGGKFELVEYRHSPAVATMEGIRFKEHEFELHPGDSLFVYTDGVPEATNAQNELYGTDRMLEALNSDPDAEVKQLLENVKKSVDDFVGDAPQFDDLTMLAFDYFGV